MTDGRVAVPRWIEQLGARAAGSTVLGRPLAVRSVSSEHVSVDHGAVGAVLGNRLRLRQSATGVALGRDVGLHQGGGLLVAGGRVTVEQGASQWLVGAVVEARQTFALAVIAGQVSGSVRCLLDARGAVIFGIAFAVTTFALRLLTRRG